MIQCYNVVFGKECNHESIWVVLSFILKGSCNNPFKLFCGTHHFCEIARLSVCLPFWRFRQLRARSWGPWWGCGSRPWTSWPTRPSWGARPRTASSRACGWPGRSGTRARRCTASSSPGMRSCRIYNLIKANNYLRKNNRQSSEKTIMQFSGLKSWQFLMELKVTWNIFW